MNNLELASTLNCRLLCASVVSNYITIEGKLDDANDSSKGEPDYKKYYDAAGFVSAPTIFVGGVADINACLVGTNQDGVILAFRGTFTNPTDMLQTLLDWLKDFMAKPIPAPEFGDNVKVHYGFWSSLNSLWSDKKTDMITEVKAQMATNGGNRKLYITGHSKGGALASLAALRFAKEESIIPTVLTIASPKTGDEGFQSVYQSNISENTFRYEYINDFVPLFPPDQDLVKELSKFEIFDKILKLYPNIESWNYKTVGALQFINEQGTVVDDYDSKALKKDRIAYLMSVLKNQDYIEFFQAHDASCNGAGYFKGICSADESKICKSCV
jgi:hypothetical protein